MRLISVEDVVSRTRYAQVVQLLRSAYPEAVQLLCHLSKGDDIEVGHFLGAQAAATGDFSMLNRWRNACLAARSGHQFNQTVPSDDWK